MRPFRDIGEEILFVDTPVYIQFNNINSAKSIITVQLLVDMIRLLFFN